MYHSSASRDFVIPGYGTGLYCSEGPPQSLQGSAEVSLMHHVYYCTNRHRWNGTRIQLGRQQILATTNSGWANIEDA